jgi:putative chitinase
MKASGAAQAEAAIYLPFLQGTCKAYEITNPRRIAGFLSQIGHESAGFKQLTENLNYSTDAIIKLFGRHRITIEQANQYGRKPGQKADQQALANILYGGEWGRKNLGNTQPGDGWRYRGRGLKQLTGRDNYARCGAAIGEDLINFPDRLLMPVNAALSAGWFWSTNGLNAIADRGDLETLTRKVNGGMNGFSNRVALYHSGLTVFA